MTQPQSSIGYMIDGADYERRTHKADHQHRWVLDVHESVTAILAALPYETMAVYQLNPESIRQMVTCAVWGCQERPGAKSEPLGLVSFDEDQMRMVADRPGLPELFRGILAAKADQDIQGAPV